MTSIDIPSAPPPRFSLPLGRVRSDEFCARRGRRWWRTLPAVFALALALFAQSVPALATSDPAEAKAERQLEIARQALDPGRFALTRAERALDAVFHPQLTTDQYIRACVMYGVLFLARDDEVQAQFWFEKAFHKSDAVTLEAVLGPAVRGYGPKINQRFADIKAEFQRSRPALPTIAERLTSPISPIGPEEEKSAQRNGCD